MVLIPSTELAGLKKPGLPCPNRRAGKQVPTDGGPVVLHINGGKAMGALGVGLPGCWASSLAREKGGGGGAMQSQKVRGSVDRVSISMTRCVGPCSQRSGERHAVG